LWIHHSWVNISLKPQNGKEILVCVNNFVAKLTILKCHRKRCKSRGGIFGIVNSLPLGDHGLEFRHGKEIFLFPHNVQSVFGVHLTSYTMDTRSFLWVKRSGREGDRLPYFSAEVKNLWPLLYAIVTCTVIGSPFFLIERDDVFNFRCTRSVQVDKQATSAFSPWFQHSCLYLYLYFEPQTDGGTLNN